MINVVEWDDFGRPEMPAKVFVDYFHFSPRFL
jgi:hypothetical protein